MRIFDKINQYQFNIRIGIVQNNLFDIENQEVVIEYNSCKRFFKKHSVVINADPFLFVHGDYLYLFYEEQIDLRGKGIIKMVRTKDLKKWTKSITVLEEKFHLSYPNVFKLDSGLFMIPETGNDKSIKLYKPNNNLTVWKYYKTLLAGQNFVDSCILKKESKYYLFTTVYENNNNKFLIYVSDKIDGEWKLHPDSPINSNSERCGGTIFQNDGSLFRPGQTSGKIYGNGLNIYKIVELTPQKYLEKEYRKIIPNDNYFYLKGGHHFSYCQFNGKNIIATDGLSSHINFLEIIERLRVKFNLK
jgi:hypothetical protein